MLHSKNEHLTSIDSIKGIGAFIIAFTWHYQHFGEFEVSPFSNVFKLSYVYGWSMVEVFFMLSGFGMLVGYGKRVFNKEIAFKDYFVRRWQRLYPLFIFSTLLVFVLQLVYNHKIGEMFVYQNFDLYHLVQNILMIQHGILGEEFSFNGPAWCLPINMLCYCLFYYILSNTRDYRKIFIYFILMTFIGSSLVLSELPYPMINDAVGRGIVSFSIGVLLAFVYENRDKFNSVKLGYCCLLFFLFSYVVLRFKSMGYSGVFVMLMDLGLAPSIILSTLFIPWQNAFMRNPVFKFLGNVSWEVYLFHFPVQCCIRIIDVYFHLNIDYASRWIWALYVMTTIGVSYAYHYLLSKKVECFVIGFFKIKRK